MPQLNILSLGRCYLVALECLSVVAILSACGPEPLSLPDQPIDRAATCAIVAAASARQSTKDVSAPLPLAVHGRIAHYALLAATDGGTYTPETAGAVSRRMGDLKEKIADGQWQPLEPACRAAYPTFEKNERALPADGFEARLQCSELGEFLYSALKAHESDYRNEIVGYRNLHLRLDEALARPLLAKAGSDLEARRKLRHDALVAAAALGNPVAVMEQCFRRFG
ncbi:MAG TPA: hypothetical protein VK472_06190 [Allosphingosinicella sp.]|nr:hypothetical protein [Allosphingosinicella sp.]